MVDGSVWDDWIFEIIDVFYKTGKSILGICYGHQALAYYLSGRKVVRRSKLSQFGFREINFQSNEIFCGISGRIFGMEAHLDEVYALPPEYKVIAWDRENVVQAYQFNDERVWGIQFHPEYDYFMGLASWERKKRKHPEWLKYYQNEVPNWQSMANTSIIFKNFITK